MPITRYLANPRSAPRAALSDGWFYLRALHRLGLSKSITPTGALSFVRRAWGLRFGPQLALLFHAHNRPDKAAIIDNSQCLSYAAFDQHVNQLSHGLIALGVDHSDRVALMLPNCVEHLIAQQAIARIGATSANIGCGLKAAEIAQIVSNAKPRAVLVHRLYLPEVCDGIHHSGQATKVIAIDERGEASPPGVLSYPTVIARQPSLRPPRTRGKGGSTIVYTSGTTGVPKGANRDLGEISLFAVVDLATQVGLSHEDRQLIVCPLYHSAALAFSTLSFGLGSTVVLMDHFDGERVLETIAAQRVTGAVMVPTMLHRLATLDPRVRERYDLSSLRWILSVAAPLPTETARRFRIAYGSILWNFYGSTETGMVTLAGPMDHESRPGTIGRLLRGNSIRLIGTDGQEVPVGQVGELFASNEMTISGYHRDQGATQRSMRDGFFSVGDLARVDSDGYYYLVSRKDDMIISGGINVYPREIEEYLHTHSEIVDVAVVGVPNAEWGEQVKAFVVARSGALLNEPEVIHYCREGMAAHKCPRSVEFVDALPRNPTGKILKRELRQQLGSAPTDGSRR